ncbi:MAG: MFS transporter [Bdellovibrionales bacterium]
MKSTQLLSKKRFGPLFWTLFFGAFNDNFLKNALIILITYKALTVWGLPPSQMVALSGGIFILPFFLFSFLAGQMADKFEKSNMIRLTKWFEVLLMLIAAWGFYYENYGLLVFVLLMMGLHSTFFGPLKYSILPQHLAREELVLGNALVEMGTFVAILIGTIAGGVLISIQPEGALLTGIGLVAASLIGLIASYFIPAAESYDKNLKISYSPAQPVRETFRVMREVRSVFLSIMGISWFWLFGGAILSILPTYTKDVLGSNAQVVTWFLALFTIGIGVGSMLCEKLSFERLELGLVPLGSIGITLFTADLFFLDIPSTHEAYNIAGLLQTTTGLRISFDLFMLAISSGFLTVPLYTLIQERSKPQYRSRIVAGNNFMNAMFMVVSAMMISFFLYMDVSIPQMFLILAALNAVVSLYIYSIIPEFFIRFFVWIFANLLYRLKVNGLHNIPRDTAAVLVCNHVSFVDWLVIAGGIQRPVRFVMDHSYAKAPFIKYLFRHAKVIPIASRKEDANAMEKAFELVSKELREGELVCIFPEGKITRDGNLNPFRPGIERIVKETSVPVIPMALIGLWGSFFSFKDGLFSKNTHRFWARVQLDISAPIPPERVTAAGLQQVVSQMIIKETAKF